MSKPTYTYQEAVEGIMERFDFESAVWWRDVDEAPKYVTH